MNELIFCPKRWTQRFGRRCRRRSSNVPVARRSSMPRRQLESGVFLNFLNLNCHSPKQGGWEFGWSPIQSVVLRFDHHQAELRTQLDEITAKMDELQVWGAGMQGSRFREVHFFFFLGIVLSVGERWVVSCCSPTWSKS